ncbi:MAG: hypothetical protein ACQEP8_00410 [Chlamydiota bacterium]
MSDYISEIQDGTVSPTTLPEDITIQAPFWYIYLQHGYSQSSSFTPSTTEFQELVDKFSQKYDSFDSDSNLAYQDSSRQDSWKLYLDSNFAVTKSSQSISINDYTIEEYLGKEYLKDISNKVSGDLQTLETSFKSVTKSLSNLKILTNIFNKKNLNVGLGDNNEQTVPQLSITTDINTEDFDQVKNAYNDLKDLYTNAAKLSIDNQLKNSIAKVVDELYWYADSGSTLTDKFTKFKEQWVANKVNYSGNNFPIVDETSSSNSNTPPLSKKIDDGDIGRDLRNAVDNSEFYRQLQEANLRKQFFELQEFYSSARKVLKKVSETLVYTATKNSL